MLAADVAARLRLSNAKRMRLIQTNETYASTLDDPRALAYKFGAVVATDRLLLDKTLNTEQAAAAIAMLKDWKRPKLPVSGGDLIAMGLTAGPVVAKTMQALEEQWIAAGFPADKNAVRAMARRLVDQLLRSSQ